MSSGEFQRELQQLQAEPVDGASNVIPLRERVVGKVRESGAKNWMMNSRARWMLSTASLTQLLRAQS